MTSIDDVFMLSIDDKLDYKLMKKIHETGHSRVPVYEEVEVPLATIPLGSNLRPSSNATTESPTNDNGNELKADGRMTKVKKIVGVLLVKHCVLLDPTGNVFLYNTATGSLNVVKSQMLRLCVKCH